MAPEKSSKLARVFEFSAVPDALRRLESGQHLGKIVIRHA